MKTVRTVLATLAGVLLAYSLTAWICVRADAAFVQRTIYQGFDQTFIIALVMGGAFLLITVILTVAMASADAESELMDEEEDLPEEDEEEDSMPAPKLPSQREQSYRRPMRPNPAEGENLEDILNGDEEANPEKITFAKPAPSKPAQEAADGSEAPKAEPVKAAEAAKEENVIYCIYCGSKVDGGSAYCPKCGKKL